MARDREAGRISEPTKSLNCRILHIQSQCMTPATQGSSLEKVLGVNTPRGFTSGSLCAQRSRWNDPPDLWLARPWGNHPRVNFAIGAAFNIKGYRQDVEDEPRTPDWEPLLAPAKVLLWNPCFLEILTVACMWLPVRGQRGYSPNIDHDIHMGSSQVSPIWHFT